MPSTLTFNDHGVPTKIIRVYTGLSSEREDMIEIFLDPSILKFTLNDIIINQHDHEEAEQGNGVLREVFRFLCIKGLDLLVTFYRFSISNACTTLETNTESIYN